MPRLIATDLDGTLLSPAGRITARTQAALEACWAAGLPTLMVTARPPRWLDGLADGVGEHGLAICSNGAFTYDVARRQVLSEDGFAADDVRDVAQHLRFHLPGIRFGFETARGLLIEPDYPGDHDACDVVNLLALQDTVGKLIARCPDLDDEDFRRRTTDLLGHRATLSYSGQSELAEIGPNHISKAHAVDVYCQHHGIDVDDVWAFGDMPNDVPMLQLAGRSFAVGNAHPDAVAAATDRCPSNADDGVAVILEQLLKGR